MALDALRDALDALDEHVVCDGTWQPTEPLAIMLPDGDVGAVGDPGFVAWLLAHSELAPFGDGAQTRLDPEIRNAQRLIARGKARVTGLDLEDLTAQIEGYLLPAGQYFEAELTDVLVYPTGGRFATHRDTPYTRDLVGTLIVELPSAHAGGAFIVDDGSRRHTFDWSTPSDEPRWIAIHADVDHEVELVTSGARVTLVYALSGKGRGVYPTKRFAEIQRVIRTLREPEPFLVACARHVIAGVEPPTLDSLRGADREIAQAFLEEGYRVTVRECLIASPNNGSRAPRFQLDDDLTPARLALRIPPEVLASLEHLVTFARGHTNDFGGAYPDEQASSLAAYLLPAVAPSRWVIRRKAAATLLREAFFDQDGFFGNGGFDAYLYSLAALEVTRR